MAAGLYTIPAGSDAWASYIDQSITALNDGWVLDQSGTDATGAFTTRATFATNLTFTLTGDQTTTYVTARRLRIVHAGGTTYCEVLSSAFGALTTVTIAGITSGPAVMTAPITSVALSLIFRGLTGNESHTIVTTTLAADTVFSSCASVYADGPSVTLDAGKWLISATLAVSRNPGNAGLVTAKLWDGTTLLNSAQLKYTAGAAGDTASLALSGLASSSGIWKVSAACDGGSTGNLMRTSQSASSTPAQGSNITAVKVL